MNANVNVLKQSELRISKLQSEVAVGERANQAKSKELMSRERRLDEREALLDMRVKVVEAEKEQRERIKRQRNSFMVPALLLVCIGAGYFAYKQVNQNQMYFKQVQTAQEHVDKLTRVLNLTQSRVVSSNSTIQLRNAELEQTQKQLSELENELKTLKARATAKKIDEAS